MSKHRSITVFIWELQTWFVVAMVIGFGLAVVAGIAHRQYRSRQGQRYEQQRLKQVQVDQKKLDEFRY
jgi:hypothetical protein